MSRRTSGGLRVACLVLAVGLPMPTPSMAQSAAKPCAAVGDGNPDRAGNDPQPTRAEAARRLDAAGCGGDAVDTSAADGKTVARLFDQLMQQSEQDLRGQKQP